MKLKLLDWYIIKKFLGTYFFAIALIIAIAIVFDISEKIDDFMEKGAPLYDIIFRYYLNFIPWFANLFSSLFVFIAVIFFTAKMANQTEIVAMLSAGISFNRIMRPYFIAAAFLAALSFTLNGWIIPAANKVRMQFEDVYIHNPSELRAKNKHVQVSPGVYAYFDSFDGRGNTGYRFTLEKIKDGQMVYKLETNRMKYDSLTHHWKILENYSIHTFDGMKENIRTGMRLDTVFPFRPNDFIVKINKIETMNNGELSNYIASLRLKGAENVEEGVVELYKRAAMPFAAFILTLLGVSLSSRKVRGGIGMQMGIGLTLSFTYILFQRIFETFAINGGFPPLLAVWIPNVIFSIISLVILRNAPK
ncbi:MAG: LptF/LptG family permease [Bacteroidota bacterium]